MDGSGSTALDLVRDAVQHPSKCSPDTVVLLRQLLGSCNTPHSDERSRSATPDSRPSSRQPSRKVTRATRSRTTTKLSVYQTSAIEDDASLTKHDKLVLATDIFNTASRSLSEYIKIQAPRDTSRTPETKKRIAEGRGTTPKKPLQPTSPNRVVARSPVKGKCSGEYQGSGNAVEIGVSAIADCARLALSSLRFLRREESHDGGLNTQLEQGLCVLVGKMLAVGLDWMAIEELRKLKTRFQFNDGNGAGASKKDGEQQAQANKPLEELMQFEEKRPKGQLVTLIISFQFNVLKIITSERKSSTVNRLPDVLTTSNPSSPSNMVMEAYRQGLIPEEKAIQQLQSLASTVLSLAVTTSSTTDNKSLSSKMRVKPVVALRLQLLALEIRTITWKVSKHKCDEAKELWDPLARYFTTFARRSSTIRESDYDCVKEAFEKFKSSIKQNGYDLTTNSSPDSPALSITFRILSQLAHSAGQLEDASKYCEVAIETLPSNQHLQVALCRCKVALLTIELLPYQKSLSRVTEAIDEASKSLASPLKGAQADIEELVVESARLKKAAMGVLASLGATNSTKESHEKKLLIFRLTTSRFLINFVRLLNRYLLPSGSHDTPSTTSPERLEKFRNIATAAVDSAISLGRVAITTGEPAWEEFEPLLSDCLRILVTLREGESDQSEPALPGNGSGFLKLSNLFWSLYISGKEAGKEASELVRALERSVSILQRASPVDQSSGLIAIKWEKLANLYAKCGQRSKSESAYLKSIRAHLDAGALGDISFVHPPQFWSDPKSPGYALGRVLSAFLRSRLKHGWKGKDVYFDCDELEQGKRAFLLERQMMIMLDFLTASYEGLSHFSPILLTLLSLYPLETYPIRRMRVILQTLRFLLECRSNVDDSFRRLALDEANRCLSCESTLPADRDLSLSRDYVISSLRLSLGFLTGQLPVDTLEQVVKSWVQLMQGCGGWEDLETLVDDVPFWASQINSIVDYLALHGHWRLRICALTVLRQILELQPDKDYAAMVTCLSKLSLQYGRLGYDEQARASLMRAECLVRQHDLPPLDILRWHLAYAEHLLATGKIDKCVELLSDARSIFEQCLSNLSASGFETRFMLERYVADATSILSQLSLSTGELTRAAYYAKSAMKLSSRIWARLDKYSKKRDNNSGVCTSEQEVETVTKRIGAIYLSSADSAVTSTEDYYHGSLYWPHFQSHCNSLIQLSRVSAHIGLFLDAVYYGEQALEIAKSVGSKYSIAMIKAELAKHHICGGQLSKGEDLLSQAIEESRSFDKHIDTVLCDVYLSTRYHHSEKPGDANEILTVANRTLMELSQDGFVKSLDPFHEASITEIEKQVEELSIKSNSRNRRTVRSRQVKKLVTEEPAQNSGRMKKPQIQKEPPHLKSSWFLNLHVDILRRQALALLACQRLSEADARLDEASAFATSGLAQVTHSIARSELLLASAIKKLASHGVYCVLHESTISLPSIQVCDTSSNADRSTTGRKVKITSSSRRTKPSMNVTNKASVPTEEFTTLLSSAKNLLSDITTSAILYGSTKDTHDLSFLLGRISMLRHATTSKDGVMVDSFIAANAIELGRNTAFVREDASILLDKRLSEPPRPLEWPEHPAKQASSISAVTSDLNGLIDILPANWQVVSLTLSADRNEFVISRFRAGQAPFLLCLPLKRSDPENVDEEEFDFASGKAELLEIIKLANETAHATEARFDRKLKKQWWANREALDERLRLLLYNIEAVWFGGFRGVFSPKPRRDDLLSKFIDTFHKILEKHLPSRRKPGKAETPTITLDRNVLELFVNIGSLDDDANPEDSVMDLLYFVVDILQFHGEWNAYDEIDFDMMVVETLDALRAYRQAEQQEPLVDQPNHTVLVLDRALHSFPWESLDCLQGSSVSRMPSLDCLRDRLLQAYNSHPSENCPAGFYIDRRRGSYILNPGGDLKSTQATFESSLSKLEGWTDIVQRDPSEEEFKDALESKDLLLYFGHGSGAQYIRGRTIKRLNRCAVTFLMGCSSGLMTEAGEFESHGTPWNYMHAGCPALVATLWDVTDKDIDRFANSVFEQWGLWDTSPSNGQSPVGGKTRRRGAERSGPLPAFTESACLDTAVAKSRGACILKYLNGAAPVVYGIPVFLK
ncbi:hypothetical protein VTO42DRAFT_1106 [Malbranchea cinnamomea]